MEIIREPQYPEENVMDCKICLCTFKYFNNEIIHEYDTDIPFCSGTGYHVYTKCPSCESICTIKTEFYEDEPTFGKLIEKIKSIFKKKEEKGCRHCGSKEANYCEGCYQGLIAENARLQLRERTNEDKKEIRSEESYINTP